MTRRDTARPYRLAAIRHVLAAALLAGAATLATPAAAQIIGPITLPARAAVPAADTVLAGDTVPLAVEYPLTSEIPLGVLWTIGGARDDDLRLAQLLDGASTAGYLIRSPSSLHAAAMRADGRAVAGVHAAFLLPHVRAAWNSALPYTPNGNGIWAGRGRTLQATGGVRLGMGRAVLTLAPQIEVTQNADFQTLTTPNSAARERHAFASPWYGWPNPKSIDLPQRFGRYGRSGVGLGQSALTYDAGPVVAGIASESQWWGPGLRNAIVLSDNAPGFVHAFVRTGAPLATPIGEWEAELLLGTLHESDFFDRRAQNDSRSLSAVAVTYRPLWEPELTLGFARAVYAADGSLLSTPQRLFDALVPIGRPRPRPVSEDTAALTAGRDQLFSLFGRWVFPASGFEVWGEWARAEEPRSLRDLMRAPYHSQGYTLGSQWARRDESGRGVRLQAEATYLEQSSSYRQQATPTFYTSRSVAQGYTHRGQVLGAAIGPGSSSQWLAADYLAGPHRLGLYAARIRWMNDAYYEQLTWPDPTGHDVSLLGGVRVRYRVGGFDVSAEYGVEQRIDYLFQHIARSIGDVPSIDIVNQMLRITIEPGAYAR